MPNARPNRFRKAAGRARKKTDEKRAEEIAKLEAVNWKHIRTMLPDPTDEERLDELMQIVNDATDHNQKVASLIKNINTLGGVVMKVLSKVP